MIPIHILAQISPLNSLLDSTAYSASLLVVFPIAVDRTPNFHELRQKTFDVTSLPPTSPQHPIPSKSSKLYLQNAFRIQSFFTISIVSTLVSATIIYHFDCWNSFLTSFLASMLVPYTLNSSQQWADLLKHRLEHNSSLIKTSYAFHFMSFYNIWLPVISQFIDHLSIALALLQTHWLLCYL